MRRLCDVFTAEESFAPYPGSPFEPALLTDHVAPVAEEGGEIVGTVYANICEHLGFVDSARMLRAEVETLLDGA